MIKIVSLVFFLLVGRQCLGQVEVILARPTFSPEERVRAEIANRTDHSIVYCIHVFGQTAPHSDKVETTFLPFEVQMPGRRTWKHLFIKRWSGRIIMEPDIGVVKGKDELRPGETHEFSFWLGAQAEKFRLVLNYSSAPDPNVCSVGRSGKRVLSKPFRIQ